MKVSVATLLALRLASCYSYSVSAMIVLIACQSFFFDNGFFEVSLCSIIVSNRLVYSSSFWVTTHARSYVTSGLLKLFLPYSNILK